MNILCHCLIIICFLFPSYVLANPVIHHLIVFGDSLSDQGYSKYGGFNRYSNGPVWPEYFIHNYPGLQLEDYAWGGAKTDSGNYNGMNWSGLQWQIDRYHPANDPSHSLIVIWCGVNDLIEADANPGQSAQNIINAIDGLTEKGARHLVILTLPDITLAPAYNDQSLPDYAHYAAIKEQVKNQIYSFNQRLVFLVNLKKESVKHNGSHINIQLIDFSNFLNQQTGNYKNTTQPWLGTYQYPDPKRWMWWDAWHPMTDVHKNISGHLIKELRKIGYQFGSK